MTEQLLDETNGEAEAEAAKIVEKKKDGPSLASAEGGDATVSSEKKKKKKRKLAGSADTSGRLHCIVTGMCKLDTLFL